jgi:hypothetical protein
LRDAVTRAIIERSAAKTGGTVQRIIWLSLAAFVSVMAVAVTTASGASPKASCNGVLVSSLAGEPGVVAALTQEFHDAMKAAGLPPGFFDVAGAHEHAGGIEECLAALGG